MVSVASLGIKFKLLCFPQDDANFVAKATWCMQTRSEPDGKHTGEAPPFPPAALSSSLHRCFASRLVKETHLELSVELKMCLNKVQGGKIQVVATL